MSDDKKSRPEGRASGAAAEGGSGELASASHDIMETASCQGPALVVARLLRAEDVPEVELQALGEPWRTIVVAVAAADRLDRARVFASEVAGLETDGEAVQRAVYAAVEQLDAPLEAAPEDARQKGQRLGQRLSQKAAQAAALNAERWPVVRVSAWDAESQVLRVSRFDGTVLPRWTGHWDSVALMLMLFELGAEAVYWVDADALIVGAGRVSEALSSSGGEMAMVRHPGPPVHWNYGVCFAQNTVRVRALLRDVLARGPGYFPWYQQQILNGLLGRPAYRGVAGELGDEWNSTWGINEHPRPEIVAWHGMPGGGAGRAAAMEGYLGGKAW